MAGLSRLLAAVMAVYMLLPLAMAVSLTPGKSVDIDRARLLAKFSNIAYCSESKVTKWDCSYCSEEELKTFVPSKFLRGDYDTQGYMGYDDVRREIMVVMQGSASIRNWIANLQLFKLDYDYPGVSGARVHGGFYKSSRSLFEDLRGELVSLLQTKPGYRVTVTGHSQGGATAMMVALMIKEELGIIPEVQTFGEPRVGNVEYANHWKGNINETIHRFTHKRDPVPQLPPDWLGFHHRPIEVWLQNGHGDDYVVCDWSGEDPECSNSVWLPIDVFDHLWYLDIYLGIPCI